LGESAEGECPINESNGNGPESKEISGLALDSIHSDDALSQENLDKACEVREQP
jgi:hypothetical protein